MNDDSSDIPLMGHAADPSRGANGLVLLQEIAELLKGLLKNEESGHIDLRTLPLTHLDYEMLRETLGEGAISAEVQNLGVTHILQTGVAGVWWITHYNEEGDVIGEFIEVAFCPEALIADLDAVEEGTEALQARLMELKYLSGRPRKG